MELLKEELRQQKNIVQQQKKEIEKLKIQNAGLLEKLNKCDTKSRHSESDSDIEIIEIDQEPQTCFTNQQISKFKQLNLRPGVEVEKIPVHDLDGFVAIVSEKDNETKVKLPKPPRVEKRKRKIKRMRNLKSNYDNFNTSSEDDLEYYNTTCTFRDKSSNNLRKLINAGKYLKSKIKAGGRLPNVVELA